MAYDSSPPRRNRQGKNKVRGNEFGIDLDDALGELNTAIETSVNFVQSEFGDEFAKAERYYAGEVDLPEVAGRSSVVKTEMRDVTRALMPSIMRVFLQSSQFAEFIPSHLSQAAYVEQQGRYVTQLFWANDGYNTLKAAIDTSMRQKIGPVKTYWEEDPFDEYNTATGVTAEVVEMLEQAPDVEIIEVTAEDVAPPKVQLYTVEWYKTFENGRIRMEAVPNSEFFISRNADNVDDASVHGHRRDVLVSEAIELGLDHDDWMSLNPEDPEMYRFAEEGYARRGYQKHQANDLEGDDVLNHKFLLTECYATYDLEGKGYPQKYVFWLGGSGYEYLGHDKVDEWCFDIIQIDPQPFTVYGRSIFDLTGQEQDTETSLLRAMVDNVHMANEPRYAANPMLVDFNDLMNNTIGAPIKTKAGGQIETVATPFTGGNIIPVLQYLETDTQTKVGVTKAAQGLDPDAMQSTDKDAVRNTIALAQGQVELMVRNIMHTGLMGICRKLLRLSIRHFDAIQVVRTKGVVLPVNIAMFDPDLVAEPKVGLGTASPDQKLAALQFTLGKQEQIIQNMGLDNPFVSLAHIYNTLEDITELSGLYDVGRYYKIVTPEIEAKLAQQRAEAMKKAEQEGKDNQPLDPSKAMVMIENIKAKTAEGKAMLEADLDNRKLTLDAIRLDDQAAYNDDRLVQDRIIKLAEITEKGRASRADDRIRREQLANNKETARQNARSQTQPAPVAGDGGAAAPAGAGTETNVDGGTDTT